MITMNDLFINKAQKIRKFPISIERISVSQWGTIITSNIQYLTRDTLKLEENSSLRVMIYIQRFQNKQEQKSVSLL